MLIGLALVSLVCGIKMYFCELLLQPRNTFATVEFLSLIKVPFIQFIEQLLNLKQRNTGLNE
jgi:hypothetical protein